MYKYIVPWRLLLCICVHFVHLSATWVASSIMLESSFAVIIIVITVIVVAVVFILFTSISNSKSNDKKKLCWVSGDTAAVCSVGLKRFTAATANISKSGRGSKWRERKKTSVKRTRTVYTIQYTDTPSTSLLRGRKPKRKDRNFQRMVLAFTRCLVCVYRMSILLTLTLLSHQPNYFYFSAISC